MISVVIPVYNDPEGLKETLGSLVNQNFSEGYEIIVVDNNSTDSTPEVIKKFENDYPDLIKGLEENNLQSSYAARNKGVINSDGDIICFIDADMWVNKNYLSNVKTYFQKNPEIGYIGCQVEIVKNKNTIASKYDKNNGFPVKEYMKEKNFVPTCCLSVRKSIFENVGLFKQELVSGGDKEFGKRVNSSSINMKYVEDFTAFHPARETGKEIFSKYFRIGRGKAQIEYNDLMEDSGKKRLNSAEFLKKGVFKIKRTLEDHYRSNNIKKTLSTYLMSYNKKIAILLGYEYQKIKFVL